MTTTTYGDMIKGDRRNYNWASRFDLTEDGYLGITQFDGVTVKDRVLLSPKQVKELAAFIEANSANT